MLELTVEKISKLHIIYKKRTFIATKANFNTNLNDILMYKKRKQNHSSLAAILGAILYQGSLINCSQITKSHFEPFYAWTNLNLMQLSELSSFYDVFIKQA